MDSKPYDLRNTSELHAAIRGCAEQMTEVTLETVQSHLCTSRMKNLGGWELIVGGWDRGIVLHIKEIFDNKNTEINLNRSPKLTKIRSALEEAKRLDLNAQYGLADLYEKLQREVGEEISWKEITINLSRFSFHSPPDDVDSLKLAMRVDSHETTYGRHEVIFELRVFLAPRSKYDREQQEYRLFLATYRENATELDRRGFDCHPVQRSDPATNLARWKLSGEAEAWVRKHPNGWNHADWIELLGWLRKSQYWPMEEAAIGQSLETAARAMKLR